MNIVPDEFIERKISISCITSTEYWKGILPIWNPKLIESSTARLLCSWCKEYFDQYDKAPDKDIEGIYTSKLKTGLQKEQAEWIEDILESLSDESINDPVNIPYQIDQTKLYFRERSLRILSYDIQSELDKGHLDIAEELFTKFVLPSSNHLSAEEPLDAWEIYKMEDKNIDWLVKDLIPIGLTIFGGASKAGKSFFVLNLAMALAQKKKIFGEYEEGFRGKPGPILYLSLEDPPDRFKRRMKAIEPNEKNINPELLRKNLIPRFSWEKLNKGGIQAIGKWIESVKRPRLVVIDVLAKVWDKKPGTGGGGQYAEDYAIYSPLVDLAHNHKISIILITHTKKGKEQDIFNEILGSMGTQGAADNLIVLSREPGNKRRLSIRGKDIAEQHLIFATENDGAKWIYEGEAGEVQKTAERQDIVNVLQTAGKALTPEEIRLQLKAMESSVSPKSVQIMIRKMLKDGTLEQPHYGKYCLPGYRSKAVDFGIAQKLTRTRPAV